MSSTLISIIEALCNNLDEQVRVYDRLLEQSSRQLVALREQNPRGVHEVLPEIEITMLDRAQAEHERNRLIPMAAAALGVPIEEVTAKRLAKASGDDEGSAALSERLSRASARLIELVSELDTIVVLSRSLLEQELVLIDGMVQGMTQDRRTTPTYGKQGTQVEPGRLRLLDAQV